MADACVAVTLPVTKEVTVATPPPDPGTTVSADVPVVQASARRVHATGQAISDLRPLAAVGDVQGLPRTSAALEQFRREWTVALGEAGEGLKTLGDFGDSRMTAVLAAGGS